MILRTALSAYTAHEMAKSNASNPDAPCPYYTPADVPGVYPGRLSRIGYRRDLRAGAYYPPPQQPTQVVYQMQPPPPPPQQVYYPPPQSYPQGPAYNAPPPQSYPGYQRGASQGYYELPQQRSAPGVEYQEAPREYREAPRQYPPEPPSYQSSTTQRGPPEQWAEREQKPAKGM
ncbi:hypothetical protein F5884DRAFT_857101 [Xylogone sp. PMI_703]|nr:hypothetical protein F5884DRAFT_857101 [Xylogone sp. PMI_703]